MSLNSNGSSLYLPYNIPRSIINTKLYWSGSLITNSWLTSSSLLSISWSIFGSVLIFLYVLLVSINIGFVLCSLSKSTIKILALSVLDKTLESIVVIDSNERSDLLTTIKFESLMCWNFELLITKFESTAKIPTKPPSITTLSNVKFDCFENTTILSSSLERKITSFILVVLLSNSINQLDCKLFSLRSSSLGLVSGSTSSFENVIAW